MSKSNRSGLWNRFLLFLTFPMLAAKLSEMITRFQAHNLKIQHPTMTSMASIMAWPNILKIVSTKCKSSKYWWDIWILGRGCKKNQMSSVVRSEYSKLRPLWNMQSSIWNPLVSILCKMPTATAIQWGPNDYGIAWKIVWFCDFSRYFHKIQYFTLNYAKII